MYNQWYGSAASSPQEEGHQAALENKINLTGCPRINFLLGFGYFLDKNVIDGKSKEINQYLDAPRTPDSFSWPLKVHNIKVEFIKV